VENRVGDLVELVKYLGATKAAFIGHDHGAATGWLLALLAPQCVACFLAISVSYQGRPPLPLPTILKYTFGDPNKPYSAYGLGTLFCCFPRPTKYMYMLHHLLPHAARDYAKDTRQALMLFYGDPEDGAKPPTFCPQPSSNVRMDKGLDAGPLYDLNTGATPAMWERYPQPGRVQLPCR